MTERSTVNHGGDGEGLPHAGREPTDPPVELPAAPDATHHPGGGSELSFATHRRRGRG